jgi:hypothetical protein
MIDDQPTHLAYKIRYKTDNSDSGMANWSPLRQLNFWARSSDTFTLRAFIMAFGWKPFLVVAPRAHHFSTLDEAYLAIEQIIYESSLLSFYAISPHLSLADLFMLSANGSHVVSESLRDTISSELEICDVVISDHEYQVASLKDSLVQHRWYVVSHSPEDGHLFLVGDQYRITWVPENDRDNCWSSEDELSALSMAKAVTRAENYYTYPLRFPVKAIKY